MRITAAEASLIAHRVRRRLGPSARIWLFGSRLDEDKRGGDLDLYVEAEPCPIWEPLRCKLELEEALDMPVDLIVRGHGDDSPIASIAKQEGHAL